jgi:hypothetical protein
MYSKNDYLNSFITNTDDYYMKWIAFYRKNLIFMFKELLYQLKKNNLYEKVYTQSLFSNFCRFIYQKSSKRILND